MPLQPWVAAFHCCMQFRCKASIPLLILIVFPADRTKVARAPFVINQNQSFPSRTMKSCNQDDTVAAHVTNVAHSLWEVKQNASLRCRQANIWNKMTFLLRRLTKAAHNPCEVKRKQADHYRPLTTCEQLSYTKISTEGKLQRLLNVLAKMAMFVSKAHWS